MEEAIEEHLEVFGVDPYIIGLYWSDQVELLDRVCKAIEDQQPYDERLLKPVILIPGLGIDDRGVAKRHLVASCGV